MAALVQSEISNLERAIIVLREIASEPWSADPWVYAERMSRRAAEVLAVIAPPQEIAASPELYRALAQIDLIAAEMGYPDTLGFHEAKDRILEITAAALTKASGETPQEGAAATEPEEG